MELETPQTKNVVTFIVYNEDGTIDKECTVENKYTPSGFVGLVSSTAAGKLPHPAGSYGGVNNVTNTGIIWYGDVGLGTTSESISYSYTNFILAFYYNLVASDTTASLPNGYTSLAQIPGNKTVGSLAYLGGTYLMDVEFDYEYEGVQYLSNVFKYDFGYGNINRTINKVYQVPSDYGTFQYARTELTIPGGLNVSETQRLVVKYRHLFDYKKYYNGTLQSKNLTLRPEYTNMVIASGTFNNGGTIIPYTIKINNFLNAAITSNTHIRLFSQGFVGVNTWNSSIDYNQYMLYDTNKIFTAPILSNSTGFVNAISDETKISREVNIKLPATAPAMTALRSIYINPYNAIYTQTTPVFIMDFETPWDKPAEMEINIQLKWDEVWSQP